MTDRAAIVQVRKLADAESFRSHLEGLDLGLSFDSDLVTGADAPLAAALKVRLSPRVTRTIGNRFAVLPMEGWDATNDGRPTELVARRWERFGSSGAKLVWGGEAVAVRPDGRANPNQLCIGPESESDLAGLRSRLVASHSDRFGRTDDLLVGLQLTHSGRWSRPAGSPVPRVGYRHPLLDRRVPVTDTSVLSDDELDDLSKSFVEAAEVAADAGFDFVDVKACHGYLLHEMLSGVDRPGAYGGGLEGRSRLQIRTLEAIRTRLPDLGLGVRLSLYDLVPFIAGPDGVGELEPTGRYRHAFGATA